MKATKRGERARDIALITVLAGCAVFTVTCSWQGLHPVEPTHWIENSAPTLSQQKLEDLTGQHFHPDITMAPCGQSIPNTIPGKCALPDGTVITAPDTH